MRKFSVTVNGTTYEVEIEEVTGSETVSTAATAPKAAPAPALEGRLHPRLRLLPEPRL